VSGLLLSVSTSISDSGEGVTMEQAAVAWCALGLPEELEAYE